MRFIPNMIMMRMRRISSSTGAASAICAALIGSFVSPAIATPRNIGILAASLNGQSNSNIACVGTPIAPLEPVLFAPKVPQPSTNSDVVGINIQNNDAQTAASRYTTFGQVFVAGKVHRTDILTASTGTLSIPMQMDALALWPDGSVKIASLTLKVPALCGASELPMLISKSAGRETGGNAVDLKSSKPSLVVTLTFEGGSYTGTQVIDLGAALQHSLKVKPDYWLHGPMVTQARVDVPLSDGKSNTTSTLHLTADISVYSDGTALADVQFNNDLTTVLPQNGGTNPQPPLPVLAYTANINFQGKQTSQTVNQVQYADWHSVVWSTSSAVYNVQHDIAQLQRAGAILPYDLTTGVNNSLLQGYEKNIIQKSDFGQPMAKNGVSTYMPGTGGRPDIGFTTQFNTVWLVTQDNRAAKIGIAQGDTSGAIPWNYKLPHGNWLTPDSHIRVWVDGRGGPHGSTDGVANTATDATWKIDTSHQPNLNYVPYLMTGTRWSYDRQQAQAAFNLTAQWPGYRCKTAKCNTLLNGQDQLRGQAWSLRELVDAVFIGHPADGQAEEMVQTLRDNWLYVQSQLPAWSSQQGEASGWMPADYGKKGATTEWQQDFFTAIASMAALMGDSNAQKFVSWQHPWLTGRFLGNGMNPHDGCTYNLMVFDPSNGIHYRKWSEIANATALAGLSNGNGWKQSEGYYCQLAIAALNMALTLDPHNSRLQKALDWVAHSDAPFIDKTSQRNDPTFNLARPNGN